LAADSDYAAYTNTNVIITFNTTINNTGATAKTKQLWYSRNNSTWTEITGIAASSGSYTHNVKALLGADNTSPIYYKFKFTDSTDAFTDSAVVSRTVTAYATPTYSGNTYVTSREMGDTNTTFTGSITHASQRIGVSLYSSIVSCAIQYSINGGTTWVTALTPTLTANAFSNQSYNNVALKNATQIKYRVQITTTDKNSTNVVTTVNLSDVNFLYKNAFGYSTSTAPTLTTLLAMGNNAITNGKAKTVTATAPAGNYTYYAYCAAAGDLSGIIMDGVTPVLGSFTKQADITGTNSFGATVTYRVYKSNAPAAFTNNNLVIT